jgi:hypothetical protein
VGQNTENNVELLLKRIEALEAEGKIRRLVARYMEICDALGPDTPLVELAELFTTDAVWEGGGKAYEKAFGGHEGRDEIAAFLQGYCVPQAHFKSNVHFLTTEVIEVTGDWAKGSWVMLQTPTFATDESFALAARLSLQFAIEDGHWRIARFKTTNLFGRPIAGAWQSSAAIPVPTKSTV